MRLRNYLLLVTLFLASCAAPDTQHHIVISTRDQKLALLDRGNLLATYPVSTSKFGLGDRPGSRFTPLGQLQIAEKIGDNAPPGAVFKDRRRTGEIVLANSPGRDPIVTRILWLRGRESQNANAFASGHLHSRHTGGTADRKASELRMYSNALNRHRPIVQHRWNWRGGHDRGRAARQRSSRYGFRSFNGTGKHGAVCDALGNSLPHRINR